MRLHTNTGTLWAAGHPRLRLAPDLACAQELFLEAASDGCADAMFNLGNLLDKTGFLPEGSASSSSTTGSAHKYHANLREGRLKSGSNPSEATAGATSGNSDQGASSEGRANIDTDPAADAATKAAAAEAAAHWFAQAAALNHAEANHALALMEVSGRGTPQDLPSAARRLRKVLLLAQPPSLSTASSSSSFSGKERRDKEEEHDGDDEEGMGTAIAGSKTNSFLNAQYLLGILALKGELDFDDGHALLDGIVPGQSTSSSSTVSGDASSVNLVAAGVRLIHAAANSGHLQARKKRQM